MVHYQTCRVALACESLSKPTEKMLAHLRSRFARYYYILDPESYEPPRNSMWYKLRTERSKAHVIHRCLSFVSEILTDKKKHLWRLKVQSGT